MSLCCCALSLHFCCCQLSQFWCNSVEVMQLAGLRCFNPPFSEGSIPFLLLFSSHLLGFSPCQVPQVPSSPQDAPRLRPQVLLYGDNWAQLLQRMQRRMTQLALQHPLLVIAIGAAAPVCRALRRLARRCRETFGEA